MPDSQQLLIRPAQPGDADHVRPLARGLHAREQRPEHGPRLIRDHVARHKHKAAPDDFEDPLATRSKADRDSLPARTTKRLLVRRDR